MENITVPTSPKVPGTNGDAEPETQLLIWALATLSPKVPGTNGDGEAGTWHGSSISELSLLVCEDVKVNVARKGKAG